MIMTIISEYIIDFVEMVYIPMVKGLYCYDKRFCHPNPDSLIIPCGHTLSDYYGSIRETPFK